MELTKEEFAEILKELAEAFSTKDIDELITLINRFKDGDEIFKSHNILVEPI